MLVFAAWAAVCALSLLFSGAPHCAVSGHATLSVKICGSGDGGDAAAQRWPGMTGCGVATSGTCFGVAGTSAAASCAGSTARRSSTLGRRPCTWFTLPWPQTFAATDAYVAHVKTYERCIWHVCSDKRSMLFSAVCRSCAQSQASCTVLVAPQSRPGSPCASRRL